MDSIKKKLAVFCLSSVLLLLVVVCTNEVERVCSDEGLREVNVVSARAATQRLFSTMKHCCPNDFKAEDDNYDEDAEEMTDNQKGDGGAASR